MSFKVVEETPYVDPHSRGTGSIVTPSRNGGYVVRTRGEHNRMVKHDYRCPIHGVFEAEVPSGDVPDEMACPAWFMPRGTSCAATNRGEFDAPCGAVSPWQPPSVAQGWAAGKCKT